MLQLYYLSITCNALAGYLLLRQDSDGGTDVFNAFSTGTPAGAKLRNIIAGIVCFIVGVLKLLSSVLGTTPVVGDLFPALSGVVCGFILCLNYYSAVNEDVAARHPDLFNFITKHKKIFGSAAVISAVLHFMFPTALFL
jgi:hypothetical protein